MPRLILVILMFAVTSSLITIIAARFTKKRFIKYIPAIIPLFFCIISIYNVVTINEGFSDIANFLSFILFLISLLSIILTGIIIDYRHSHKKKD